MIATTPPSTDGIVRPQISRPLSMRLAAAEYARMADAIAALRPDDWARPTACTAWDVRELACHMVGMAAMVATPWEMARVQRKAAANAKAAGTDQLTAVTALQVSERADMSTDDIVTAARRVGSRAVRGRRLTPRFMRNRPFADPQHVNGRDEAWAVGFLSDVILTRDPWMHRMDLAAAIGTDPVLTSDHDGAIVADVVAEWASRHDAAYDLELTGPAGGSWRRGRDGERIEMDAIDFCRSISGRGDAPGLLSVQVPF